MKEHPLLPARFQQPQFHDPGDARAVETGDGRQVRLIHHPTADHPIVEDDGEGLGTDDTGKLGVDHLLTVVHLTDVGDILLRGSDTPILQWCFSQSPSISLVPEAACGVIGGEPGTA